MADECYLRQELEKIRTRKGNEFCADCGQPGPDWAVVNIGVFVCIECAGIHRQLGVGVSRVLSTRLDKLTDDMVEKMRTVGNSKARHHWEAKVPIYWPRPTPNARMLCREQWIRAKYERKEFILGTPDLARPYLSGARKGFLYKRKKGSNDWQRRWFKLDHDTFSYYITTEDRRPKATIPLRDLHVLIDAPGLEDQKNSMLIGHRAGGKSRNIFVYSETGKDVMHWYMAIQSAKLRMLKEVYPGINEEQLVKKCTWTLAQSGYLYKMPPNQKKFQRRFFVLDKYSIRYYDKPTDAHPLGEIQLGSPSDGFEVLTDHDSLPEQIREVSTAFMLRVPHRSGGGFPLMADTVEGKREWTRALCSAISGVNGDEVSDLDSSQSRTSSSSSSSSSSSCASSL